MSETIHNPSSLEAADAGDSERLLNLVYGELRELAASKMANEAAGHTLQPTALVHEAWLRLVAGQNPKFENQAHFFAAAAEAMRRILIDRARQKRAMRHGGGQQRVNLQTVDIAAPCDEDELLQLDEALEQLAVHHPVDAQVVKLRHFVGMTIEETAAALDVSPSTVKHYWNHARAWLFNAINPAKDR